MPPSLKAARPRSKFLAALDPARFSREISGVESPTIKVIGQQRKSPWQRFARLQRTAAKLARGRGQPKGVFRFASNEACTAWTGSLNRNGK
jgi:hypothetical protein